MKVLLVFSAIFFVMFACVYVFNIKRMRTIRTFMGGLAEYAEKERCLAKMEDAYASMGLFLFLSTVFGIAALFVGMTE
jgi:hypothetical protein